MPADRAHDPSSTLAAQTELSSLASARTILVVDDDLSIRQLLAVILEVEGYRVHTAACAQEALAVLQQEDVDLITLDVMMPDVDGWSLAEQLDGSRATARIPRIMISGKPLKELQRAPGAGRAAAILTKPFDFAQVSLLIRQLLALRTVPAQRSGADAPAPEGVSHPRA